MLDQRPPDCRVLSWDVTLDMLTWTSPLYGLATQAFLQGKENQNSWHQFYTCILRFDWSQVKEIICRSALHLRIALCIAADLIPDTVQELLRIDERYGSVLSALTYQQHLNTLPFLFFSFFWHPTPSLYELPMVRIIGWTTHVKTIQISKYLKKTGGSPANK